MSSIGIDPVSRCGSYESNSRARPSDHEYNAESGALCLKETMAFREVWLALLRAAPSSPKISPPNLFFEKLLFPSRKHRLSCRLCGGRISTQAQSSGWINTSSSLVQECHSGASLDHRFLEQECLEQECLEQECLTVPERGMAFSTKAVPLVKRANRAAANGGSRPMVCAAGPRPFDRCVRLIRQTGSTRQLASTVGSDGWIRHNLFTD
jgi:hypothetical protein